MGVTTLVLFFILAVSCCVHSTERVIYVDSSRQTGVNDSCWEEGFSTPCLSLNLALKGAQHYNHSITILLQPGQHQLHNGSETQLRNMSQLAIVGNTSSEGEVVIKCLPLSGLAFFRSNNITMKNIQVDSCGALQDSIIKSDDKMQSAIFPNTCNNIQLINVDVVNSNGAGILLYNPSGVVHIDMCNFINNSLPSVDPPAVGGGGLVIEADDVTANYDCMVMNCTFLNNTAKSRRLSILSQASNPSQYFGLGGGITIVFREGTVNNTVQLAGVRLENNIAQFGGGLYLAFFDSASGNYVTIDGIEVANNTAMLEVGVLLPFASGGGILIDFSASQFDYPFNNTVEMLNSRFLSNTAQLGGGIAVDVVYDGYGCVNADNKLLIENCSFDNNEGYEGSSAYFSGTNKDCRALLNTTLSFNNFIRGHCAKNDLMPCMGSVFLRFFPIITMTNAFLFSENSYSAMSLISSSIQLLTSAQLRFLSNTGVNGAALHIVDCSSVIVNDNTSIYFENNQATHDGGAIYSETCMHCFIRHEDSNRDPNEWKINVSFSEDHADHLGDSIYIDSIQSCVWSNRNKDSTFCWKGWSYGETDICLEQLRTGPAYLVNNGPTKYTVYPGECISLKHFTVFDDYNNDITDENNLQVNVLSGRTYTDYNEQNCSCIDDLGFDDRPCESHEVAVRSSDCYFNYSIHSSQVLIHPPHQSYGIVLDLKFKTCEDNTSCGDSGTCTRSRSPKSSNLYMALCYYNHYFDFNDSYAIICGRCNELDRAMIINVPISTCISCENASGVGYFIIQILLVMIMMTILAVLHINITNGNLNAYILYSQMVTLQFPGLGYTSWVSDYGQLPFLLYEYNFISVPFTVYSIWNLNFLTLFPDPFCIPGIRTAVGVILLQYVTAVCPLLFIIVSYTWIQCYNNGYRLVVYTTRPVHRLLARFWQKFKIKPSLIDTYAGLLLLAYMRFLAVSVKLLMLITFDYKFASSQVAPVRLVIIPILCLLVFVILPMAVLLLYPFKIFQRCLTCCRLDKPGLHALVDAYQGCFKNSAMDGREGRYFAGLFLLFRFGHVTALVFALNPVFTVSWSQLNPYLWRLALPSAAACLSFVLAGLILLLQPYKKTSHNVIDFLTLFWMALCGALAVMSFYVMGCLFLPFLVLVVYFMYRLIKCCCGKCCCLTQNVRNSLRNNENNPSVPLERQPLLNPTTTEVKFADYVEDDVYPRIVDPGGYTEL